VRKPKLFCKRGHSRAPENLHSSGHCKICRRMQATIYRHDPKRKQYNYLWSRRSNLGHNYKMTVEDYNKLLEAQNNCCAICRRAAASFKKQLSVDHDHKTGKIRGLLCIYCNSIVINLLENRPELLPSALIYLQTNKLKAEVHSGKNWNEAK